MAGMSRSSALNNSTVVHHQWYRVLVLPQQLAMFVQEGMSERHMGTIIMASKVEVLRRSQVSGESLLVSVVKQVLRFSHGLFFSMLSNIHASRSLRLLLSIPFHCH